NPVTSCNILLAIRGVCVRRLSFCVIGVVGHSGPVLATGAAGAAGVAGDEGAGIAGAAGVGFAGVSSLLTPTVADAEDILRPNIIDTSSIRVMDYHLRPVYLQRSGPL